MKVVFTEQEKERQRLAKQMDRFDALISEYQRAHNKTNEEISNKLGISLSSFWRYRKKVDAFAKAPFDILCKTMRLVNASNTDLRCVCGWMMADEN